MEALDNPKGDQEKPMASLLTKVLDAVGAGDSDGGTDAPLPELSDTVRLPPPSEAMKETRRKLAEIEKAELAELREQLKAVNDEIAEERKVVEAGDFNLAELIAKGTPKSKLQKMRVDAELAAEIIEIKENAAADIKAKIDTKRHELLRRSQRLMGWLQQTEVQTRAYQISLITGADRLTNEKFARAYRLLQSLEEYATEMLGEDLSKRVIASITNNPVPPTLHECLLLQMPRRDRDQFESEKEGAK